MTLGGGSTATTCLPAHSQATVTLSFVVDEDAIDDTEHQATVHIREESDSNEIYLDDNMDTTSVRVYRADVIISKE
ncbi:MAG: hypothetical protein H6766_05365 [Candidatus Peribacteria bacterium]|nr:MAG: hypothetical protein H6766_05365 [Candidatus Peribacteria bacterium]